MYADGRKISQVFPLNTYEIGFYLILNTWEIYNEFKTVFIAFCYALSCVTALLNGVYGHNVEISEQNYPRQLMQAERNILK